MKPERYLARYSQAAGDNPSSRPHGARTPRTRAIGHGGQPQQEVLPPS
ncbi:hypothetical protein [Leptolyngbya iicbica]|uniref:Uncharacterized protein n=1 Tax=Lyngbya confervoides BDU141951 TaxID=1574623 RepID=A0A8T6QKN3_9CYAN|nr:hypothetical protein [Leptolyngbya sp. LK]